MKKYKVSMLQLVLTITFVSAFLISNIIASRQISLPFDFQTVGSVVVFPITYILSDIFSEVYGYRWSRITCYFAFIMNIFMVLVFTAVLNWPYPEDFTSQDAFITVLGSTPRITAASLIAFVAGDLVNDLVFRGMKRKHQKEITGFSARAILSSLFGEFTDCSVFLPLAFLGTIPAETLFSMGTAQVISKVLLETFMLPVTRRVVLFVSKSDPEAVENAFDNKIGWFGL